MACYSIEPIEGDEKEPDKLTITLKNDCKADLVRVIWNEKKDSKDHLFEAKPAGEVEMKPPAPSDDDKAIVNKLQLILVQEKGDDKEATETVLANVQFQKNAKLRYMIKIWDRKQDK